MKTYLTAIFCVTRAVLFPETKIIAAAGLRSQSREVIQKIDELRKNSPLLQREISDLKVSINDSKVEFHNGSWIRTVASNDGARGARSNLLIVDEFRMVDIDVITSVLKKFQTAPRQPKYLNKPQYAHMQERNKEIYLSSAWMKSHHSFERVQSYAQQMAKGESYFVCSLPYQVSIKENLLMREQVQDEMSESTFNEISWLIEMESIFWGESTKSMFKFDDMHKNRKLGKAYYPKEVTDMVNDKSLIPPKKEYGEIRIISADIATMLGAQNDASAYTIARLIPKKDGYDREVIYMETLEGGHTMRQAVRIKQLFYDFDCDYCLIDRAGGGIGVLDAMFERSNDSERGTEYEAFSCMNNEELAKRCMYPNAPKVVYALHATASLNSEIAVGFRDALRRGKIKLPVVESEAKDFLKTVKGFDKLPESVKNDLRMPYVHTTVLINETVNLEAERKDNGDFKITEKAGNRKDRYTSLSYLNHLANELEIKNRKQKQSISVDKLFRFKKGSVM